MRVIDGCFIFAHPFRDLQNLEDLGVVADLKQEPGAVDEKWTKLSWVRNTLAALQEVPVFSAKRDGFGNEALATLPLTMKGPTFVLFRERFIDQTCDGEERLGMLRLVHEEKGFLNDTMDCQDPALPLDQPCINQLGHGIPEALAGLRDRSSLPPEELRVGRQHGLVLWLKDVDICCVWGKQAQDTEESPSVWVSQAFENHVPNRINGMVGLGMDMGGSRVDDCFCMSESIKQTSS